MTAADLLRRAADHVERIAADATAPPWFADEDDNCWRLHGHFASPQDWPGFVGPSKQILKAPKRNTPYAEYWPEKGDAHWITTMHPGVAAPLAAWLHAEADTFEREGWDGAEDDWPPLAFSRALLREEP